MEKAKLFEKLEDYEVKCTACCQGCIIKEGETGICGVRKNISGELFLTVYGEVISMNIDAIEKKPLFDFMPGSYAFSLGTTGCNFSCDWCQNWDISQWFKFKGPEKKGVIVEIKEIVEKAKENNCKSIAYTYTEPTIFIEFVKDISVKAKKEGLKNVWVSNGYLTKKAFDFIGEYIDAMNIDIKSFKDETYKKYCKGILGVRPVLDTIRRAYEKGIHIEITTLVIPDVNDSDEELKDIANFIFSIDGKGNIPWHISRFFPMYKMDRKKPTPLNVLDKAFKIGKKAGLKKIYRGNV